jgi:hypothetical protein
MPSKQAVKEVCGFGGVSAADFEMHDWMSHPLSPRKKIANDSTGADIPREFEMN